ncbi:hypothetical protein DV738_g671, partial [Chaetothyriales sp. CBS 135597]
MLSQLSQAITWLAMLVAAVSAYRPVQFVKHTGDNGRADQGFSLTQYYNTTTEQSDLYVRFESFRYESSALGWASLALGPQMAGALMFILYGDPTSNTLTFSVRTADGHHPPLLISSMTNFYQGPVPEVEVLRSGFEPYSGTYQSPITQSPPSHIGVVDFIVRGYDRWTGCDVSNSSVQQQFIWSSNFKQDFGGDFSVDRHIDMHQFGLGFGWAMVDLANAQVPEPFFSPIGDEDGHKGVNEIAAPDAPTQEELNAGAALIAALGSGSTTSTATTPNSDNNNNSNNSNPQVEQPAKTHRGSLLRTVMWHIHGLLMVLAFLVFMPLGTYLIRSGRPTAFNMHWTVQALAGVAIVISSAIGYATSRRIVLTHQYIGLAMLAVLAAQAFLGWRHHVIFVATKRRTWFSTSHVWLGRLVLPVGFLNTLSGLRLRHYSSFTQMLVVVAMLAELVFLTYYVLVIVPRRAAARALDGQDSHAHGGGKQDILLAGTEADEHAEEYFELGEDDDDDDDDLDSNGEGGKAEEEKRRQKAEQAERLRRLDRV